MIISTHSTHMLIGCVSEIHPLTESTDILMQYELHRSTKTRILVLIYPYYTRSNLKYQSDKMMNIQIFRR
jgi:hypothetical protein